MSEPLLESELFGHVRGAFSGAERERGGLVTEARGGTLFLDEIGDASAHFQALLLRLLENGEYRAVGSNQILHADCRVVAATNVDLEAQVAAGRFRRDLWFRLRRLELALPPLEQRRDDIIPIALHLLDPDGTGGRTLSDDLARHLRQRSWPGNVRQLRNELERMLVLAPQRQVYGLDDFLQIGAGVAANVPPSADGGRPDPPGEPGQPLGPQGLRRLDHLYALFLHHRRMSRADACRLLGISPTTATADLRALCEAGLVQKITPTRSPATHYFVVAGPARK